MYEPCMVIDIIADAARNCNPHFEMFSREDEKGFAIPGKICYNIPEHERNEVENVAQKISNSVLKRLPVYLSYLKSLPEDAPENISATTLAAALNMGEVQVRKDLALVSDGGRPKIGYQRLGLVEDIEQFLGYDNTNDAVLIGAGKLGRALLGYSGFSEYGLNIVAAFDSDASVAGTDASGKPVLPLSALEDLCSRRKILIGILTVPAAAAQGVCDLLIRNGIKAIWNFAPTHLDVPPQNPRPERKHGDLARRSLQASFRADEGILIPARSDYISRCVGIGRRGGLKIHNAVSYHFGVNP